MTYGLALEGGGARGAAHVGVLRAFKERNLLPDCIAGTSAGAIVAAAYAWRGRVEDALEAHIQCGKMQDRLMDLNLLGMVSGALQLATLRNFRLDGVFKGGRLYRWIDRLTEGAMMTEVAVPLAIPAVDLVTGRIVAFASRAPVRGVLRHAEPAHAAKSCVLGQGETMWEINARLSEAVRASTAVPVAFRPLLFDGMQLVDGGLLENLPVSVLSDFGAERVLGVVLETPGECEPPDDVLGIGLRSIDVMQARLGQNQEERAHMLLRVRLPGAGGLFDFSRIEEYERLGYEAAIRATPRIKALFRERRFL